MKAVCQNDRLWNVLLYDVIVWINPASAEDQQHHCLFSPAHHFYITACLAPPTDSTSVCLAPPTDSTAMPVEPHPPICACCVYERGKRAGLRRNQTIKMLWRQDAVQCQVVENSLCFAFLLNPMLGKSKWALFWMNIQTASVSINGFVYKQGTIQHGICRKI